LTTGENLLRKCERSEALSVGNKLRYGRAGGALNPSAWEQLKRCILTEIAHVWCRYQIWSFHHFGVGKGWVVLPVRPTRYHCH
jgi:hypothetical protein